MADEAEKPVESTPAVTDAAAAPAEVPVAEPTAEVEPAPAVSEAPVSEPAAEVEPAQVVADAVESVPAPVVEPVAANAVKPVSAPAPKRGRKPVAKVKAPATARPTKIRAIKQAAPKPVEAKAPVAPVEAAPRAVEIKAPAKLEVKRAPVATPAEASADKPTIIKTKNTETRNTGEGTPSLSQLKDKLMAKTTPLDFTTAFQTAFAELQDKAKAAYEKSTVAIAEANDFAKGNVEALVESGKILASGLQELGTTVVTDTRSAFDTVTAEVKELAAAKSPAEFFQIQSALLRKNFDSAVAQASKSTEAVLKLGNEVISPLSTRVTLAVEKASKAA